jgi:hypothetical protein
MKVTIPNGWRQLEVGEIRMEGDKALIGGQFKLSCLAGYPLTRYDSEVIRPSDKPKSFPKATFNPLSLVPNSILKGAKKLFSAPTSKERIQDYLKRSIKKA